MEYIENGIALITVLIIVEAIKRVTPEKYNRYLPLLALIIGGVANSLYVTFTTGLTVEAIFAGIIMGGAAAGIYDVANKTILGK